jgi:hypothetical protein
VGHHHHSGGGGGGHHHHHHHHSSGSGISGGFGGGYGGPWRHRHGVGTSWPFLIVLAGLLFVYGAFDTYTTYRVYAHGERGMGVVTRVYDGTTIMEVGGAVCAIDGEHGRVGGMLPVAFPPGRPARCVVHELSSFHWGGGAMLFGALLIGAILALRRDASAPTPPPPA